MTKREKLRAVVSDIRSWGDRAAGRISRAVRKWGFVTDQWTSRDGKSG